MDQQPCDCKHEGWPRAVSNLAIAAMLAAMVWALAWAIVSAVGK